MNRFALLFVFGCCAISVPASGFAQEVIAFWDFNDGFSVDDETAQIAHTASVGTGTIYQQRADTDGNGKGGNEYANMLFGIDVEDGKSIAWDDIAKGGSDNDGELFIEFSTTGFQDIQISFDLEWDVDAGQEDLNEYDLKYDNLPLVDVTNPAGGSLLIKDFANGNSTTLANNLGVPTVDGQFVRTLINLTGEPGVDDQASFALRFDDFGGGDDVRFDNFLVTGTAIGVPEPASISLLCLAVGVAGLRRQKTAC